VSIDSLELAAGDESITLALAPAALGHDVSAELGGDDGHRGYGPWIR